MGLWREQHVDAVQWAATSCGSSSTRAARWFILPLVGTKFTLKKERLPSQGVPGFLSTAFLSRSALELTDLGAPSPGLFQSHWRAPDFFSIVHGPMGYPQTFVLNL